MADLPKKNCELSRPVLVWLGAPLIEVQTEVAKTFDVCSVSGLHGALRLLQSQPPAAVVCFLDACDHPPEFVHLLLNRMISDNRLIYVWPADIEGSSRFRQWTNARVLSASFRESELVEALHSVVDGRFSLLPVPVVRPRGCA